MSAHPKMSVFEKVKSIDGESSEVPVKVESNDSSKKKMKFIQ